MNKNERDESGMRGERAEWPKRGGKSILCAMGYVGIIAVLKFIGYRRCVWVNLLRRARKHIVYGFPISYASKSSYATRAWTNSWRTREGNAFSKSLEMQARSSGERHVRLTTVKLGEIPSKTREINPAS